MPKIASRRVTAETTHKTPPLSEGGGALVVVPQGRTDNSLTAAGQMMTTGGGNGGVSGGSSQDGDGAWKVAAWNYYNSVGELRYVCSWLSNALSRCTIVGSDVDENTGQPLGSTEDEMVNNTVRDIAGGPAGQAALFARMATFLTVPGELYIAIIVREQLEEWYVLSTDEVIKSNSKVEVVLPDGKKHQINDEVDTIARVYRPHPRKAMESDSPVRAAIPILREIVRLGQHVESTAKSRLSGNGLLVLPQELSMPVTAAPTGAPQAPAEVDPDAPGLPAPAPVEGQPVTVMRSVNANDVMGAVIQAASTAMDDPGAAAGQVPIMLQAPGEHLDKIKHITMGSEFTKVVMELREAATKRLALSLDVPAEILLGAGDMNHWSAWQVEESAIKLHVEPLMTLICDALTEYILRPLLIAQKHPDPESVVIWYDTTGLSMRPNRSQDAKDAYDRGAISPAALRDALGFTEGDAPVAVDGEEAQKQLAMQLVTAAPSLLPLLAGILGLDIAAVDGAPAAGGDGAAPPAEDTTPIPDEPTEIAARLVPVRMAAEMGLQRALSLAGNRLRTRGNLSALANVPRHDTHAKLHAKVDSTRAAGLVAGWDEILAANAMPFSARAEQKLRALVTRKAEEALIAGRYLSQVKFAAAELQEVLDA